MGKVFRAITSIFRAPKPPPVPQISFPAPTAAAATETAEKKLAATKDRKGYASTILTGGEGIAMEDIKKQKLLGSGTGV